MALTILQRVVWNHHEWRRPSGASSGEGGYFAKNGFGHEEWNFQTDDAVDEHVLGYMYYSPASSVLRRANGRFDIVFWARHPETRRSLIVGEWRGASLVEDEFLRRVDDEFERRGIWERRAEELRDVLRDTSVKRAHQLVREGVQKGWMRWRCPVANVTATPGSLLRELPTELGGRGVSWRFAAPTLLDTMPRELRAALDARPTYSQGSPLVEDAYFRETKARLDVVVPLHNQLSNAFAAWLRRRGFADVQQEQHRVDVEFVDASGLCRAELKTCSGVSTTMAIREALGQLLEYNHYGARLPARSWWIVLDQCPTFSDRAFIATLRDERGLPLVLAWRRDSDFELDHDPSGQARG